MSIVIADLAGPLTHFTRSPARMRPSRLRPEAWNATRCA